MSHKNFKGGNIASKVRYWLVVMGQYGAELVGTRWYGVSKGGHWLVHVYMSVLGQ